MIVLILHDSWFFVLLPAYLSKQLLLPDITYSLHRGHPSPVAQLEALDHSPGSIIGQVELAHMVSVWARPLHEIYVCGVPPVGNSWIGLLAWFFAQAKQWEGFTGAHIDWSVFLVRRHTQPLGETADLFPSLGRTTEQAPLPRQLPAWGPESGTAVHWALCSYKKPKPTTDSNL